MEILWLAIVIYSIGVGLVLHLKPSLMFTEKGQWKEFGYQRGPRFTIFPFWLFAVLWGFTSYILATTITWAVPALALTVPLISFDSDESEEMVVPEPEPEQEKPKRNRNTRVKTPVVFSSVPNTPAKPVPGYYVLEKNSSGINKFIYHGPDPPDMSEFSEEEVYHEEA